MKAGAALIAIIWLVLVIAAWETHDALAIGIAIPVLTVLALTALILLWITVRAVGSARDLRRSRFANRNAKPS